MWFICVIHGDEKRMMQQHVSVTVLCSAVPEWFRWQGHGIASLPGCSTMLNGKYLWTIGVFVLFAKLVVLEAVYKLHVFYGPEGSLPCPQQSMRSLSQARWIQYILDILH
jgi:hypothetical protein